MPELPGVSEAGQAGEAILRPWARGDAAALALAAGSAPDLATQIDPDVSGSLAAADAYIRTTLRHDDDRKNWAIVVDGIPVGNVGVTAIEFRHATAWMSYWLAAGARGRGLATAALVSASRWSFDAGLYRLELGHRVNNPASCRVATAAGFIAEGVERRKLRYGTERFDVETHARLADDPRPHSVGLPFGE
ncbi:MAG: family N-acetyltransferase [Microbacterium sp.]|nr:family N-acetyltransferase [Microbacterium sp.]